MNAKTIRGIRRASGFMIALGLLMMALGIAAIVEPFIATIAVARALSWTFFLAGIVRTVHAVQSRRQPGFWLKLLIGIIYIAVGLLLLSNVLGAKFTLTLAFGGVMLAQGIFEVIAAFKVRPEPNWGVMSSSGIVAIVLGLLILYRWPFNAVWLLGVFMGASFLCTGAWIILLSWGIRKPLSKF